MHAATGGNPFFVAEVAKEPDLPLPASVRDAVLARTAEVDARRLRGAPADRQRARPARRPRAPTAGHRPADAAPPRRDRAARPDRTTGSSSGTSWPGRRSRAPSRPVAGPACTGGCSTRSSRLDPRDPAVLTHHAVAARDARAGLWHARAAADESIAAGSHTEAAAFMETALEHLEGAGPAGAGRAAAAAGLPAVHDESARRGDRQRQLDVPAVAGGRRPGRALGRLRGGRDLRVLQRPSPKRQSRSSSGRPRSPTTPARCCRTARRARLAATSPTSAATPRWCRSA